MLSYSFFIFGNICLSNDVETIWINSQINPKVKEVNCIS